MTLTQTLPMNPFSFLFRRPRSGAAQVTCVPAPPGPLDHPELTGLSPRALADLPMPRPAPADRALAQRDAGA